MNCERLSWLSAVFILSVVYIDGALGTVGKIIGGRDATVGEFPYQASLHTVFNGEDYGHSCGGAIIDEHHVLTAAHCIADGKESILVVAGVLNKSDTQDPNRVNFDVDQVYIHEKYNIIPFTNDIALLRVNGSIPINSSLIRSVALRKDALEQPVICTVTGWGIINESDSSVIYPDILQVIDVPFISQDECVASYSDWTINILSGMICAGYKAGEGGTCQEDSGGPLVCDDELTGVVSWGNGCAQPKYPGVYSDVAYYYDWIEQTLATSLKDGGLQ